MIAYISGKLASKQENEVIIEASGIGYAIAVSNNTLVELPKVGENATIFTILVVKDDGISLCGFYSLEEKNMFQKLTTISGIGSKSAMCILSGMDLPSLALAIITEDSKSISKIKGVGKKTAERIILELKEKISNEDIYMANNGKSAQDMPTMGLDEDTQDAIIALKTLGISQQDAYKAVMSVREQSHTIEELITNALKSFR